MSAQLDIAEAKSFRQLTGQFRSELFEPCCSHDSLHCQEVDGEVEATNTLWRFWNEGQGRLRRP